MVSSPFAMQKIEELLNITNQQPNMEQLTNPQQAEPQEQAGGTEMVNRAIENAVSPRKPPNSFERQLQNAILDYKSNYMDNQAIYNNPDSSDSARALAQARMSANNTDADYLRNIGQSAGLDMSRFAAGQTLQDGQAYLDSEKARDILEAMQGAYSLPSDQYYEQAYRNAIMDGLSDRRAKRLAGVQAREYQANRVAYLDGVFNNYGIESDGTIGNLGMQILGMIAQDNPILANVYGQTYPNPRDAYNTATGIEKEVLKQNNLLDLTNLTHQQDLEKIIAQLNANKDYAGNQALLNRETYSINSGVDLQKAMALADHNFEIFKNEHSFLQDLEEKKSTEIEKTFKGAYAICMQLGADPGNAANIAARIALGENNKQDKGSNEAKMTEKQQERFNQAENLMRKAWATHSDEDIAAIEEFLNGEEGVSTAFAPAIHQQFQDMLLAIKGYQRKLAGDDAGAEAFWNKMTNRDELLKKMYRIEKPSVSDKVRQGR